MQSSPGVGASGAAGAFADELAERVAAKVRSGIAEELAAIAERLSASRLLDRQGLAEMLSCSLPTLDKLRAEGLPELRVGDAPRFEPPAVLSWLRARK